MTAARQLAHAGYLVVNPAATLMPATTWEEAMRTDLRLLLDCEGLSMLDVWRRSRGARLEVLVARALLVPVHPGRCDPGTGALPLGR